MHQLESLWPFSVWLLSLTWCFQGTYIHVVALHAVLAFLVYCRDTPHLFTHSSSDGYLGYLHFWNVINNAHMNIYVQVCLNFLGNRPRSEIAGLYSNWFYLLKEQQNIPKWLNHFIFLSVYEDSSFSISSPTLIKYSHQEQKRRLLIEKQKSLASRHVKTFGKPNIIALRCVMCYFQ